MNKRIFALALVIVLAFAACAVGETGEGLTRYVSEYGFSVAYSPEEWILIDKAALEDGAKTLASLFTAEELALLSEQLAQVEALFIIPASGDPEYSVSIARQSGYFGVTTEQLLELEGVLIDQYDAMFGDMASYPQPMALVDVGEEQFARLEAVLAYEDATQKAVVLMLVDGDYLYNISYTVGAENTEIEAKLDALFATFALVSPAATDN